MTITLQVQAAGADTPRNDEARGQAGQLENQKSGNRAYCAARDAVGKAIPTMKAQTARAGRSLHELACGGFLLCRWGMSKELRGPCAVGDLLRRIGGSHG